MIPGSRILCVRLKAAGYITTLCPGNRVLAEIVARLSGQSVPRTKKQRVAIIQAYAALSAPDIPKGMENFKPKPPRPKKASKADFLAFYKAPPWRSLRYDALKLHGARCQCCGGTPTTTGKPMHVDHIKPRFKFPELELVLSNLQILCEDCNIGKGGRDQTDWRSG